jgi:Domain of unknown function (DUF6531)
MPYAGVPIYYTLQPGGAVIQGVDGKPRTATIRYPNYINFGPGESMRLFDYDAHGRGWYLYGTAHVNRSNPKVLTASRSFEVYQFTTHSVSSGGEPPTQNTDPDNCDGGTSNDGAGSGGWGQNADAGHNRCGGDPVDLRTGRFTHMERDMMVSDVIPINILRTYNAQDYGIGDIDIVRPFGFGMSHPYEQFLVFRDDFSAITLVLHNGSSVTFQGTQSGTYSQTYTAINQKGEYVAANLQPIGSYFVLFFRDGRQWGFTKLNARLAWMDDLHGNRLTVERPNTQSYASRIVSPNGRWINFTYGSNGRVSEISDNTGRVFSYTYDTSAGNESKLLQVLDPEQKSRRYTWRTDLRAMIEEIWDPNQKRLIKNDFDEIVSRYTCTELRPDCLINY